MNKVCSRCKQAKDVSEFPKCINSKDGYNWYCKSCTHQMYLEHRLSKIYKACHEKYGEQCALCKSSEHLEVHHLHGKLKEDINDLLLVCHNCHLKICHGGCQHPRHFKCKRCGHEWPSKQEKPTICPKCKSPYWDKERKNASNK